MQELKVTTKKRSVKVVCEDQEYEVEIPKIKQRMEFQKLWRKIEDNEEKQMDLLLEYLEELGLPIEVSEQMYMEDLVKLTEIIGGAGKK